MADRLEIFDSTLRDGAQGEGISFSVADKLKVARKLDELGVGFIEAGNPASNPKDAELFRILGDAPLSRSKLVAFGATRRPNCKAEDDPNVRAIADSGAEYAAIFGKSWDFHVTDIIRCGLDENLAMIRDTVSYLRGRGMKVFFDAEHFFDGYAANPEYAMAAVLAAQGAGAECAVLCDTNGGAVPGDVYHAVEAVVKALGIPVGIHCHNDAGCAAANALLAVSAGARHVQGTFTGFGERCGNTPLTAVIPTLQLKMGFGCLPDLSGLTEAARFIAEVANVRLPNDAPYVGAAAFTHKAGMHIDGVNKDTRSFEHVPPEAVGNARRFLTGELAGRGAILKRIQKVNPALTKDSPEVEAVISRIKEKERDGYQFEAAEASVELSIYKALGTYKPFFELKYFRIISERPAPGDLTGAMLNVSVNGVQTVTAAEGDGPVNALDRALRKALEGFYPCLTTTRLTDYKVRVLDSSEATAAKVRVLIESSDGVESWATVGVSTDIIQASWKALLDSIEYKLLKG